MSLAAATRDAVRERPFLLAALRAGVVNYRAAADFLDLDGETDAVAAALRRFAADLPDHESRTASARVEMHSGVARTDDATDALLAVGGTGFCADGGSLTALLATGDVGADALAHVLERLAAAGVAVTAAGVGDDALAVVVARRDGPEALRVVEDALVAVPDRV
jgi:hypothetical protein